MDAKEALQYVYCMCLSADQGEGVGREQVEIAWELARRIIVLSNSGPAWEELVGGFRPDGSRFVSLSLKIQFFLTALKRVGLLNKGLRSSIWKTANSSMSKSS
jgi:hypothetical protein